MKLKVATRKVEQKSQVKALRRQGQIPAIIYHQSKAGEPTSVDTVEFETLLRKVQSGRLSTTIFELHGAGKPRKAILKDIQYNPVTYDVIHLDFEELIEGTPVTIKIPLEPTGVADCVGIKLGGFLRQVIRYVKVKCLPKDIPTYFEIDVKDLGMRESKRIKDIAIPNTVRPVANMNEVVVVIAKR